MRAGDQLHINYRLQFTMLGFLLSFSVSAHAAGGATLSSNLEFWNQPQVGSSTGQPAVGVIPQGTAIEVFHKLSDGRGGEMSYVRISSGPYTGRYVWVKSPGALTTTAPSLATAPSAAPQRTQFVQRAQRAKTAPSKNAPAPRGFEERLLAGPQPQDRRSNIEIRRTARESLTFPSLRNRPSSTLDTSRDSTQMEARLTPCELGVCPGRTSSATTSIGKVQIAATQITGILSQAGAANPVSLSGSLSHVSWGGSPKGDEWSEISAQAVTEYAPDLIELVPQDIQGYCPTYRSMSSEDRIGFWVQLQAALAEQESTYRPGATHTEAFRDSKKHFVVSRGLLQISKESARGYRCPVNEATQLHDPEVNLTCGMRIFGKQILRDGRIAGEIKGRKIIGAGRYWGAMRSDRKLRTIQSRTRKYCDSVASVPSV